MIYKFQDTVDGKFAFILAPSYNKAMKTLENLTSIEFNFIESKDPKELNKSIVLINQILPF